MTDGPLLWYLNRATGVVLLVLFTAAVVLGVLSMGGKPGRGVPRFALQALHRNLALLAVVALTAHVLTAVIDTYVDIRWWHAVVPFAGTYKPFWLGLGAIALDIMIVVVVTSLLRTRLSPRSWRAIHLTVWVSWVVSVIHAVGIGTDLKDPTSAISMLTWACVVAVLAAAGVRVSRLLRDRHRLTEGRPS
ncbi:MAG: ferric reductase-like transmembrane domain-containing protein [Micrococcales bacterium]|nr:ferric reductase-like transmembrane domain-containing protein [Micrococcales bacterium]